MAGKSYDEATKQKHVDATKDFAHKLLKEYAAKEKISVNTLIKWKTNGVKAKKPGRPAANGAPKKRGRPAGSGKKRGPGRPKLAEKAVASGGTGNVRSEIADFLLSEKTHDEERATSLLKRAYAVL